VHVRFSESQATEPPEKKQHIDPFADLRDRALSGPTTVITSVEEELASYKSLRLSSAVSPLPFWQEHSRTYPILSTVARRVFAMSASSAQSERDFSAVERTVTDARSQLSASKVESIEILRWGLRAGLVNLD